MRNTCSDQHLSYVGVTSRTLKQRLIEHKRDIQTGKLTTALAVDAYTNNTEIFWNEAKVIRQVKKKEHMYVTEVLEIAKKQNKETLLKERISGIPKAWEYAIWNC